MKTYQLLVNGHLIEAQYNEDNIEKIFIPLLKRWTQMQKEKQKRLLVLLAAPPGAGKTTLSLFLEYLSQQDQSLTPVQAIGMDGFHRYQDYLETHEIMRNGKSICMKDVKGCPETFDVKKLIQKIKEVKINNTYFPLYNRVLHNPEEDMIYVNQDIVLIEGNYLLLNEESWKDIHLLFDDTLFISADICELEKRLVQRKMMGGTPYHQAKQFYENSDGVNVERVLNHSLSAHIHLYYHNNHYQIKKLSSIEKSIG